MAADSRGPTNGGGVGGGGALGGDAEPKSKGDGEDLVETRQSRWCRRMRHSRRSGFPRHGMVNARPRQSRRDEGSRRSQWTDG